MKSQKTGYDVHIYDIEGCFPHMPKEAMSMAMREAITILNNKGKEGVWVPNTRTKSCSWDKGICNGTWIPLEVLGDIYKFAIENCFIKMPNGTIWKQILGIPMGDPLSPGICILTCGWMESEWMENISLNERQLFRGTRYMDDILLFVSTKLKQTLLITSKIIVIGHR